MYGSDTSNWDLIFILLCSDKLPASTVTLCEQTLADKTAIPKWSHLKGFLYERFRTLESVSENRICKFSSSKSSKPQTHTMSKVNSIKIFQTIFKVPNCTLCPSEAHIIRKCPKCL